MRTRFDPRCRVMLSAVFDGHGIDSRSNSRPLTLDCTPKSATVVRNSYHEPDTFSCDFDARVLPFDPESVASIAVRVYMWDSEGDETQNWAVGKYEMIRGLVDEPKFRIDDKGGQIVSLSGRDYTAALDQEWDPRVPVKAGGFLRDVVESIADEVAPKTSSARFNVVWAAKDDNGNDMPEVICGGSRRSTKKKGMWMKPGKTTWEVIYELVLSHGFIAFVSDSSIIITNPRTQTSGTLARAPRIVYGKNLLSLEASRKLAKEKVPRIIIVGWDAKARKRFEVVYPKNKSEIKTGLGLKKNEDLRLPAPKGVHDKETALRFAKMRWDLMARAEAEYKFTTMHMKVDRDVGEAFSIEHDLMSLDFGDAIGVSFDPFNREHLRKLSMGERFDFIESMGYPPAIARFIANNVERITQFEQPYYCQRASFEFDEDNGIEIEVTAANYANERREMAWADDSVPDAISGAS